MKQNTIMTKNLNTLNTLNNCVGSNEANQSPQHFVPILSLRASFIKSSWLARSLILALLGLTLTACGGGGGGGSSSGGNPAPTGGGGTEVYTSDEPQLNTVAELSWSNPINITRIAVARSTYATNTSTTTIGAPALVDTYNKSYDPKDVVIAGEIDLTLHSLEIDGIEDGQYHAFSITQTVSNRAVNTTLAPLTFNNTRTKLDFPRATNLIVTHNIRAGVVTLSWNNPTDLPSNVNITALDVTLQSYEAEDSTTALTTKPFNSTTTTAGARVNLPINIADNNIDGDQYHVFNVTVTYSGNRISGPRSSGRIKLNLPVVDEQADANEPTAAFTAFGLTDLSVAPSATSFQINWTNPARPSKLISNYSIETTAYAAESGGSSISGPIAKTEIYSGNNTQQVIDITDGITAGNYYEFFVTANYADNTTSSRIKIFSGRLLASNPTPVGVVNLPPTATNLLNADGSAADFTPPIELDLTDGARVYTTTIGSGDSDDSPIQVMASSTNAAVCSASLSSTAATAGDNTASLTLPATGGDLTISVNPVAGGSCGITAWAAEDGVRTDLIGTASTPVAFSVVVPTLEATVGNDGLVTLGWTNPADVANIAIRRTTYATAGSENPNAGEIDVSVMDLPAIPANEDVTKAGDVSYAINLLDIPNIEDGQYHIFSITQTLSAGEVRDPIVSSERLLLNFPEVSGLSVTRSDDILTLSWTNPPRVASVRLVLNNYVSADGDELNDSILLDDAPTDAGAVTLAVDITEIVRESGHYSFSVMPTFDDASNAGGLSKVGKTIHAADRIQLESVIPTTDQSPRISTDPNDRVIYDGTANYTIRVTARKQDNLGAAPVNVSFPTVVTSTSDTSAGTSECIAELDPMGSVGTNGTHAIWAYPANEIGAIVTVAYNITRPAASTTCSEFTFTATEDGETGSATYSDLRFIIHTAPTITSLLDATGSQADLSSPSVAEGEAPLVYTTTIGSIDGDTQPIQAMASTNNTAVCTVTLSAGSTDSTTTTSDASLALPADGGDISISVNPIAKGSCEVSVWAIEDGERTSIINQVAVTILPIPVQITLIRDATAPTEPYTDLSFVVQVTGAPSSTITGTYQVLDTGFCGRSNGKDKNNLNNIVSGQPFTITIDSWFDQPGGVNGRSEAPQPEQCRILVSVTDGISTAELTLSNKFKFPQFPPIIGLENWHSDRGDIPESALVGDTVEVVVNASTQDIIYAVEDLTWRINSPTAGCGVSLSPEFEVQENIYGYDTTIGDVRRDSYPGLQSNEGNTIPGSIPVQQADQAHGPGGFVYINVTDGMPKTCSVTIEVEELEVLNSDGAVESPKQTASVSFEVRFVAIQLTSNEDAAEFVDYATPITYPASINNTVGITSAITVTAQADESSCTAPTLISAAATAGSGSASITLPAGANDFMVSVNPLNTGDCEITLTASDGSASHTITDTIVMPHLYPSQSIVASTVDSKNGAPFFNGFITAPANVTAEFSITFTKRDPDASGFTLASTISLDACEFVALPTEELAYSDGTATGLGNIGKSRTIEFTGRYKANLAAGATGQCAFIVVASEDGKMLPLSNNEIGTSVLVTFTGVASPAPALPIGEGSFSAADLSTDATNSADGVELTLLSPIALPPLTPPLLLPPPISSLISAGYTAELFADLQARGIDGYYKLGLGEATSDPIGLATAGSAEAAKIFRTPLDFISIAATGINDIADGVSLSANVCHLINFANLTAAGDPTLQGYTDDPVAVISSIPELTCATATATNLTEEQASRMLDLSFVDANSTITSRSDCSIYFYSNISDCLIVDDEAAIESGVTYVNLTTDRPEDDPIPLTIQHYRPAGYNDENPAETGDALYLIELHPVNATSGNPLGTPLRILLQAPAN